MTELEDSVAELELIIAGLMKAKSTPQEMVAIINTMTSEAVAAEREACAQQMTDLAHAASIARDNFKVLGDEEHVTRHEHRRMTFLQAAEAIRARGETKE